MDTKATILQELQELSPLVASIGSGNPYRVPAGYFEMLPAQLVQQVSGDSVVFGDKQPVFAVPEGYFDGLAGQILNRVKQQKPQTVQEELAELAPLLNTISREPVYQVPEGYFESLELTVPLKLARPSARVFSFKSTKRIFQYAVAACTAGILMFGAYMFTMQNTMGISYKEAKTMNVAAELSEVKEEDINKYLNETPVVGYAVNNGTEDLDVEQFLEITSDQEINEYLEETEEPAEKIKDS